MDEKIYTTNYPLGLNPAQDIKDDFSLYLAMPVAKYYVEYLTRGGLLKKDAKKIVAAFRKRLQKVDWLDDQTRAATIEKLDNMKMRILYPDDWSFYSLENVTSPPATTSLISSLMSGSTK